MREDWRPGMSMMAAWRKSGFVTASAAATTAPQAGTAYRSVNSPTCADALSPGELLDAWHRKCQRGIWSGALLVPFGWAVAVITGEAAW